ncbi:MAG: hypothetical protein LBC25_00465, partial [Holosporales bacterium]|nr:hypothetical protein [Holosporales bacterium]
MDANLILFVIKAMKRMFCWAFALHTVCSACSGSVNCFANLTEINLTVDSFGAGAKKVSEVIVVDRFSTEAVEIQNPREFVRGIPPQCAALFLFNDYLQPFRLRVGGNTITYPIKEHRNISLQFFGNFVATTVYLARVSAHKAAAQF